jgi:hypothetical protein
LAERNGIGRKKQTLIAAGDLAARRRNISVGFSWDLKLPNPVSREARRVVSRGFA